VERPLLAVAGAASDLQSSPSRISYASQHEELLERPQASESNRRYRPVAVSQIGNGSRSSVSEKEALNAMKFSGEGGSKV